MEGETAMENLIVGVAGAAGRSTAAAYDRSTQRIWTVEAGSMAFRMLGHSEFIVRFLRVMQNLAQKIGLSSEEELKRRAARTMVSLPGVLRPMYHEDANSLLDEHGWCSPDLQRKTGCVLDDMQAGLLGGALTESGGIIVCGSGSAAYVRGRSGEEHKSDGYGPVLGDEGSGFWLGLEALRAVLRADDGRQSDCPTLREMVMMQLRQDGVSTTAGIPPWLSDRETTPGVRWPFRSDVAALAQAVARAAAEGDDTAMHVLDAGSTELVRSFTASMNAVKCEADGMKVVLGGGVFENIPDYVSLVREKIEQSWPGADVLQTRFRPVVGALLACLAGGIGLPNQSRVDALVSAIGSVDTARGLLLAGVPA